MQDADGKPHIDDVLDRIAAWLRVQVEGEGRQSC
jgi:hypothetical protein